MKQYILYNLETDRVKTKRPSSFPVRCLQKPSKMYKYRFITTNIDENDKKINKRSQEFDIFLGAAKPHHSEFTGTNGKAASTPIGRGKGMKKRYTFIMHIEATIHENTPDTVKNKNRRLDDFIRHFRDNRRAIMELYKIWLLDDLRTHQHQDAIRQNIGAWEEDAILAEVLKDCSPNTRDYYLDAMNQKDERKLDELEDLFGQFGLPELIGASFEEAL